MMKYTIFLTRECNLACNYCYVGKGRGSAMQLGTARRVVDRIYDHASCEAQIDIGFFGGEPFLQPGLLDAVAGMVESHRDFAEDRVGMSVVSNGTLYSQTVEKTLLRHRISLFVSCDGPPDVHDRFRRTPGGAPTAHLVEAALRRALDRLPQVAVNAVLHPETLAEAPRIAEYFCGLGLRQIHLSPDFAARWLPRHLEILPFVANELADFYVAAYRAGYPCYINLLDGKITAMLRGGYQPSEQCRMGRGELAFAPSGRVYPCERLVGDDSSGEHCIGSVDEEIRPTASCHRAAGGELDSACAGCSLRQLCMHWCGCSNFFATGFYNRVSAFQCAFEKAVIAAALSAFRRLQDEVGPAFAHHLAGMPEVNAHGNSRVLPVLDAAPPSVSGA